MGRIVVTGLIIGICAYLFGLAEDYPRAARRLPQILSIFVIVLAATGMIQAIIAIISERRRTSDAPPLIRMPRSGDLAVGTGFVALVALYIWSIPRVGYLIATPVMIFLPLVALRPIGWPGIAATIVAVTGVILVVFIWFLNLPIPLYPGD